MLELIGKPWWQLLGYCAGAYKFRIEESNKKGDTQAATAAMGIGKQFLTFGASRLEADRGIPFDAALAIATAEMEYGVLSAADGGEIYRPFAVDEGRCRDVRFGYVVTFKPRP